MIEIRTAAMGDLDEIMRNYACARAYMVQTGNATQWGKEYPLREHIEQDIESGHLFVGVGEEGRVHCVFAFILGEDPSYLVIEGGAWLNDKPYGTIHRLASDGAARGVFSACLAFCRQRCANVRADTHENNRTMRHLFEKNGFLECGVITVGDGTPRIAYQLAD
jgi:ribosomal protein S18 acetylase RimI-like enzyme